MAIRRRWCLIGPFFALGLLGFVLAKVWPVRYRSDALILIEHHHASQPRFAASLEDRLQTMNQQILSRPHLQELIEKFALYPQERVHMSADEVINKMRERDIVIELVKAPGRPAELAAIRISYLAPSATLAQQVVNELTALFIEVNLRARPHQQSVSVTDFLDDQLEQARQTLADKEKRLQEYRSRHLRELPEHQQTNLRALSSLQAQLNSSSADLEQAEQQRSSLESIDAQHQSMQASLGVLDGGGRPVSSSFFLKDLRAKLALLELKYTTQHPEIVKLKKEIARAETVQAQAEGEDAGQQKWKINKKTAVADQPNLIESRLKAISTQIESDKEEMAGLRQRIQEIQARLNLTPVREQQLIELTGDYETARQYYQSLLDKRTQSELATNLEQYAGGEEFRVVNSASFPQKPVEPSRSEIILASWLLGVVGGIGLIALRESTDTRLRGEEDVTSCTKIPVLVSIPVFRSPSAEVRKKNQHRLEAAAVGLLILVSMGSALYTYWAS